MAKAKARAVQQREEVEFGRADIERGDVRVVEKGKTLRDYIK